MISGVLALIKKVDFQSIYGHDVFKLINDNDSNLIGVLYNYLFTISRRIKYEI